MAQDAAMIKERILSYLRNNGPSIPVHLSQAAGLSILFTSAFLSELLSERQLKISNMRVGSSPVYFIPGQEPQLEKFSTYLKSKEKEAYLLLKEKQFLKDREQEPAIRVALRSIKDFAVPFEKNEEVVWRYFIVNESDYQSNKKQESKEESKEPAKSNDEKVEITVEREVKVEPEKNDDLNIFDRPQEKQKTENVDKVEKKSTTKKTTKSSSKSKSSKKPKEDSKFFNRVKEFLSEKNIEILDIEEIAINKIIFKVKGGEKSDRNEEYLIVAYNKKRITEEDITKAYKKAEEMDLEYKIICFGDTLKKIENMINAAKTLKSIEKIE